MFPDLIVHLHLLLSSPFIADPKADSRLVRLNLESYLSPPSDVQIHLFQQDHGPLLESLR